MKDKIKLIVKICLTIRTPGPISVKYRVNTSKFIFLKHISGWCSALNNTKFLLLLNVSDILINSLCISEILTMIKINMFKRNSSNNYNNKKCRNSATFINSCHLKKIILNWKTKNKNNIHTERFHSFIFMPLVINYATDAKWNTAFTFLK